MPSAEDSDSGFAGVRGRQQEWVGGRVRWSSPGGGAVTGGERPTARLLDLRGQDTSPAPEQLSAPVAPPGLVTMDSPTGDKLALFDDRLQRKFEEEHGVNPRNLLSLGPAILGL